MTLPVIRIMGLGLRSGVINVQLKDKHHEAIQMMILDRYSRRRQTGQIAAQVGVTRSAITQWKNDEDFKA